MESMITNIVSFSSKKRQRQEAKKRKRESLLHLMEENRNIVPQEKKQAGKSMEKSYKEIKDDLKRYIKKPELDPYFQLMELGFQARIFLCGTSPKNPVSFFPLFVEDIYHLLTRSAIGHMFPVLPKWAKLDRPQFISKTVLIVIEGLSKEDIIKNESSFPSITNTFTQVVQITSPNIPFVTELSTVHLRTDFHMKHQASYSSLFPRNKEVCIGAQLQPNLSSKLHLLLSPIQFIMQDYPLPNYIFKFSRTKKYTFTKCSYKPVTENSPLFAIDCEMCMTENNVSELTRIAIVDEKCNIVYESLVKPKARITNYLTKFSGITKKMLENVTTSLKDVQLKVTELLPEDAILCGQSLNFDLHAMKMIHPYVIDTSMIFNRSGVRGKKDSLKNLTKEHLNEDIQCGAKGHNPIEDAIATMKLVLLKLTKPIQFGDVCLEREVKMKNLSNESSCKIDNAEKSVSIKEESESDPSITAVEMSDINSDSMDVSVDLSNPETVEENVTKENSNTCDGFFAYLSKYSKKVCLIGPKSSLDNYCSGVLTENVCKIEKSSFSKVMNSTLKHIEDSDVIISHLTLATSKNVAEIAELNSVISSVHESCPDRALFSVYLSGTDETKFADIKNGLFMAKIKLSF